MPSFLIIFIILIFAVLWGMHAVVYKGFLAIFSITHPWAILILKSIFILLPVVFVISFFLTSRYNTQLTKFLYTISASWIGFLFYLFLAVAIFYLIIGVSGVSANNSFILLTGKLLMLSAVLVGIYGIYNAQNITITRVTVSLPNLPEIWKGRRAVFYSDTHLGQILDERFAERVSKKIQELNPDIIFNGGDLYDGVKVNETVIIESIKNLKAPLGHFFVMGNHEEFGNNERFKDAIQNAGIRVLNNEKTVIDGVQIIGVDYSDTTKKEEFLNILKNISVSPNEPSILMKHAPFNLDVAEEQGISLQLSGHTHRAQIFPFSLLTKIIYKGYDYGFKKLGTMQVLTTSGAGTWGPPLRVGTKSEIVLITFK